MHAHVRRRAAPKQLDVVFDNVEVSELMHLRYEVEAALTDLQPQARECSRVSPSQLSDVFRAAAQAREQSK